MQKLILLAAISLSTHTSYAAEPPLAAADSVCSPTFQLPTGPNAAGTAFLLQGTRQDSAPVLVTAHHLFGPDGGVPTQVRWDELPAFVASAKCESLSYQGWSLTAGRPSAVRNAKAYNEEGARRDIAVFLLKPVSYPALRIAQADPNVGDTVWLVSRVRSGAAPKVFLHKATVARLTPEEVVYFYENTSLSLSGTSGAPVVNQAGQVVGVNFGAGRDKEGRLLGFATSRAALADSIASLK